MDGAETRDERYGGTFQFSSVESIQEFKVQQNFVDAQYGQASAMVSAVTASGTNNFHGALYEFLRNNKFNARNFFDGAEVPPFRFNQFGGSLGGPVYLPKYSGKDKTFFFVNYEGAAAPAVKHHHCDRADAAHAAGRLERAGGFRGTIPIYDPLSGDPATGRRTPFAGNIIPANRLDPISKNLLPYWPLPNRPGIAANYVTTVPQQNDYDQVTTRIDHNLSNKDRIMGRFSYIDEPFFKGGYSPLSGQVAPVRDTGAVIQYTRVVSPRAVNEFRFAYTRSAASYSQEPVSENLAAQIGLRNTSTDPKEFGLPSVSVIGLERPGLVLADHHEHHRPLPVGRRFHLHPREAQPESRHRFPPPAVPPALGPGPARLHAVSDQLHHSGPGSFRRRQRARRFSAGHRRLLAGAVRRAGVRWPHDPARRLLPG